MPYIQFQLRRGTAATWTSNNPTLASGEMGIETDTSKFKVGDGVTAWTSLVYGGIQGPTGATGFTGPAGATGSAGVSIIGSTGFGSVVTVATGGTGIAGNANVKFDGKNINLLNGGNMNMSGFILSNAVSNTISMNAGSVSNVSNIVGAAGSIYNLVAATSTSVGRPLRCVSDGEGNIYTGNNAANTLTKTTPAGVVTVFAGTGTSALTDGTGTGASFQNFPRGMCIDSSYSTIFIGDAGKYLRKIDIATRAVTTVAGNSGATAADGTGLSATFGYIGGLAIDPTGTYIYASDSSTIRRITVSNYLVTTITTTGDTITGSGDICIDSVGSNLYLIDGTRIRKMTIPGHVVTTICGNSTASTVDGIGLAATLNTPAVICIDPPGSNLYITDFSGSTFRKYTIATSNIVTIAGVPDGQATATGITGVSRFNWVTATCVDPFGNVYVYDYIAGLLRRADPVTSAVSFSNANMVVQAPMSYRYVTSNVTGTTVDLTASSNLISTTFRLTAGPSNTITFPALSAVTSGAWWTFSNAYTAAQTLTFAGTTTGLTSPYSLGSNTSLTVYSGGSSYYTATGGAVASAPAVTDSFMMMGGVSGTSTSNKSFYSYDGITWTPHVYPSAVGGYLYPTWNGQYWLFVGSGNVGISANGINWAITSVSGMGYTQYPGSIAWNGKMWVVIMGGSSNQIMYSYDGLSWSGLTSASLPSNAGLNCVGWGKDKFVAGGHVNGSNSVIYSYDGINWIGIGNPFGQGGNFIGYVNYNGTMWVAGGRYIGGLFTSPDGITWTKAADPGSFATSFAVANGQYTLTGGHDGLASSNGGKTWTIPVTNPFNTQSYTPCWNGNAWYAGFASNTSTLIYSSPNGFSNWTQVGTIPSTGSYDNQTWPAMSARRIDITRTAAEPEMYQGMLVSPAASSNSIGGVTLCNGAVGGVTLSGGNITSASNINGIPASPLIGNAVTFAGSRNPSTTDGTGTSANFGYLIGMAHDPSTGNIFCFERDSQFIRKVSPTGVVTTVTGGSNSSPVNATGTNIKCTGLRHGVCDASGNLYFVDNFTIRRITPAGVASTLAGVSGSAVYADGTGTNATFVSPYGLAVDPAGANLYICDQSRIRKLVIANQVVTTFIGNATRSVVDGTGTSASVHSTNAIAYDPTNNTIVFSDGGFGGCLRKATMAGVTTTFVGQSSGYGTTDGLGTNASFYNINGVAVNPLTGMIFTADYNTNPSFVRAITPAGLVTTIAGGGLGPGVSPDGLGSTSSFQQACDAVCDSSGQLYVADMGNPRVAKINLIYGKGGVIPISNALYSAGPNVTLPVRAPLSYRYVTSNVTGTSVDLTQASNAVGTVFRLTAGPANTITFPTLYTTTSGSWWTFSNAFTAAQTLTFAGATTGLSSPLTLQSNSSVTIYSGGSSYYTTTGQLTLGNLSISGGDVSGITSVSTIPVAAPATMTQFVGSPTSAGGFINGIGTNTQMSSPKGAAMDPSGNIYFVDGNNQVIRKVTPAGVMTTFVGNNAGGNTVDGTGTNAYFKSPSGIAWDPVMSNFLVGESGALRRVTLGGVVTTLAGGPTAGYTNATGTNAQFNGIIGIAVDPLTGDIYCAENQHIIRKVTQAGVVTLFAGSPMGYTFSDGVGTNARFYSPQFLATDGNGTLYIADYYNYRIRRAIMSTGAVTTLAGNGGNNDAEGTGTSAQFAWTIAMAYDPTSALLYTSTLQGKIMSVSPVTGVVKFFLGSTRGPSVAGVGTNAKLGFASSICLIPGKVMYFTDSDQQRICKVTLQGTLNGLATSTNSLGGVALSESGLGNVTSLNNIPIATNTYVVSAFVGNGTASNSDGVGTNASLSSPEGIHYSTFTNSLYTSSRSGAVRQIALDGTVTTLASGLGDGLREGIATDSFGNVYVVNVPSFCRISRISPSGVVTTFAGSGTVASVDGTGTAAQFNNPYGLVADPTGTILYVSEGSANKIRRIVISTGVVTTIAGSGSAGSTDGVGTNATLNTPYGLGMDPAGMFLYVCDGGSRLRKITLSNNVVTTLAGSGSAGYTDGIGTNASFYCNAVRVDPITGNLFLSGNFGGNGVIRRITPDGVVTTVAGTFTNGSANGVGTNATFDTPTGIAVDNSGFIYVADNNNSRIRKITPTGTVGGVYMNGGSLATAGTLSVQQIQETTNTITSPSGTVVADWSTGALWYVTSMSANFTINLTNLPTTTRKTYSTVFYLVQGATPYYINALQIAGVAQTIYWSGAVAPTPTANRVETVSFRMYYSGSAWTVMGQLTSFG